MAKVPVPTGRTISISVTERTWEQLNEFAYNLGYRSVSPFVMAAILDYVKKNLDVEQRLSSQSSFKEEVK